MKQKITLLLSCLISTIAYSQSTNQGFLDWKTTDGTQNFFYKNVTKTDGLGNVYVAGATINGAGNTDILLAKYNSAGVQLWIQQYAGSGNGHDFAAGLAVTNTDVYVTGAVTTSTNLTTDVITMHYSSAGVLQWATTYNGTGNAFDSGKFLVIDGSNNVYVTGGSYNASGNIDFVTVKYSSTGTQQWVSLYDYSASLDDAGINIATNGSNVVVTGVVTSTTNNYKVATLTYAQSTGSLTATNVGTATTTSSVTAVTDLGKDVSGNIYIVGSTYVSGQGQNYYVQKLSNALVTQWTYTYNGSSNLDDIAKGIQLDASSNVYVTGYSTSSTQGRDITTVKLNSSGTQQWIQTINSTTNGDDEGADMVIDASANIYIAGYIASDINQADYYTVKYNSSGTKVWDILTDGNHLNDRGTNIALDSLNNVIVTGQSETVPNTFQFLTTKYVQKDVITPTDFNGETPSQAYWYYGNQGQLRNIHDTLIPEVLYYNQSSTPNMFIKNNSMSFVFAKVDSVAATNDTLQRVDMTFDRANSVKTYPMETQDFCISYFKGTGRDFPSINGNRKLITPDIYPNIDLMYSSNENGIKYYFIVKPSGNPANINLTFTGATSYSLNGTTNDLTINTPAGNLTFDRPTAYQLSSTNATIAVTGWTPDWQTNGASNKYKFNTGAYTTSLTLVIEVDKGNTIYSPVTNGNLVWNTYMGGDWDDDNLDLKLDRYGNIYTVAFTNSDNYYLSNTYGTIVPVLNKASTILMKYNKNGIRKNQVYLGSSSSDLNGTALTIVGDSNLVVTGNGGGTGLPMPIGGINPAGAYSSTVNLGFITKFKPALNAIEWSTHFPGVITDVDSKINGDIYTVSNGYKTLAYVKSETNATNIPASSIVSNYSQMVSKFDKNGVSLWSSFVGVDNIGNSSHIKVDTASNQFYVFGNPNGTTDWIGYNNYGTFFDNTYPASYNTCFIKKFNSSDSMIVSTYMGGNKNENLYDAVITVRGDVVFVGSTTSTDTANIIYNPHDGSYISKKVDGYKMKGWITKFSSNFTKKWATLYGDSLRTTTFKAVTTDNTFGSILLGGYTEGMPNVYYSGCFNQASDVQGSGAFASFDPSNKVTWATSMGTSGVFETGISAVQLNPKNTNLDFAGSGGANSGYPWENYAGAYWQPFNDGPGHDECTVGRFDAVYITGIKEQVTNVLISSDIVLYPNPTNTFTNLHFKQGLKGQINIVMYNALGQIMETRTYNNIEDNSTLKFNTEHLSEGVYFINISSENSSKSLKFVTFR